MKIDLNGGEFPLQIQAIERDIRGQRRHKDTGKLTLS